MTFAVGFFDLFAYAVPGSLYVGLLGYVATRLDVVELAALGHVNGVLLVAGVALLSYLLGFLAYPLGALLNRVVPRRRHRDTRAEFLRRNPAAADRDFVRADSFLLLSALQLHDMDAAVEVSRLRAAGLMSRNAAPPVLLASVAAIVELVTGHHPVLTAASATGLAAAAVLLVTQARLLGHWASLKTLELCFWLPDVDERLRSAKP